MSPRLEEPPRESGLTLVEVLVSLLLVVFVVLSISQLFIQGTQVNYRARVRTAAMSLVKFKLEELKSLPFDDTGLDVGGGVTPGTLVTGYWDSLDADGQIVAGGGTYTRQWLVEQPDAGNPDLKRITVVVDLNSPIPGRQFRVEASTLLARG